MRAIPVDLGAFGGFMCVSPPEIKANPRSGEIRKDVATGLPMFVVGVVAIRGKDSSVIQVMVPGEPMGLSVGSALVLTGLEAVPWEIEGRSGVSFRAAAVSGRDLESGSGAPARGGDAV